MARRRLDGRSHTIRLAYVTFSYTQRDIYEEVALQYMGYYSAEGRQAQGG